MCGRFTITLEPASFKEIFELGKIPTEWVPRYNAAPGQSIPVVRDSTQKDVAMLRWGLVPHWAKDISIGYRMINARAETLAEKPSFRDTFKNRRCLILADGFFEWRQSEINNEPKQPFLFQIKDERPFAFAGLWESWQSPDKEAICTCTIITCAPNELVAQFHNRMPVILDRTNCWEWLADEAEAELSRLLAPFPAEAMQTHAVSTLVNNPRCDDIHCIEEITS